jgi:hypothetical protein
MQTKIYYASLTKISYFAAVLPDETCPLELVAPASRRRCYEVQPASEIAGKTSAPPREVASRYRSRGSRLSRLRRREKRGLGFGVLRRFDPLTLRLDNQLDNFAHRALAPCM